MGSRAYQIRAQRSQSRAPGVLLSVAAVGLVVWLVAAATGPHAYAAVQGVFASVIGQIVLFAATFAFFLHFCGGRSGTRAMVSSSAPSTRLGGR